MSLLEKHILIILIALLFSAGILCSPLSYYFHKDGYWPKIGLNISFAEASSDPCSSHNVYGWAWSENVGLISFSCENTTSVGSGVDYGVDISTSTGQFSGYAWAGGGEDSDGSSTSSIGWIMLNPPPDHVTGDYPSDPQYPTKVSFDSCNGGKCPVSGWARACVGTVDNDCNSTTTSDGWDGWIKMRGTLDSSSTEYGVDINATSPIKEFDSWAWGGDDDSTNSAVVGWLSFNCTDTDSCATSDYKVLTSLDFPPSATSTKISVNSPYYCGVSAGSGLVDFEWVYEDTDNDNQDAYWLQVATDSDFSNKVVDAVVTGSPVVPGGTETAGVQVKISPTPTTTDLDIGYNNTYYWRVKVKDAAGNWSEWAKGPSSFDIISHAKPWPQFDYSPSQPSVNEVVVTRNSSICYDADNNATTCDSWLWTVNGASTPDNTWDFATGTATSEKPEFIFFNHSTYNVVLRATDSSPQTYSCSSLPKPISVSLPLPEWREVAPVSLFREFWDDIAEVFRFKAKLLGFR